MNDYRELTVTGHLGTAEQRLSLTQFTDVETEAQRGSGKDLRHPHGIVKGPELPIQLKMRPQPGPQSVKGKCPKQAAADVSPAPASVCEFIVS